MSPRATGAVGGGRPPAPRPTLPEGNLKIRLAPKRRPKINPAGTGGEPRDGRAPRDAAGHRGGDPRAKTPAQPGPPQGAAGGGRPLVPVARTVAPGLAPGHGTRRGDREAVTAPGPPGRGTRGWGAATRGGATRAGAVPMALSRCHRGARGGRGVLGQRWGSLGSPRSRVPPGRPHNKRTPPFLPHNLAVAPLGGTIAPPPQHRGLFRLRRQEQPQNVSAGGAAGASGPKSAPPTPEPPHPTAMGSPGWDTGNPPPQIWRGGSCMGNPAGGAKGGAQLRDPGRLQGGDPRFGEGGTQGTPRWGQGAPRRKSCRGGHTESPSWGGSQGVSTGSPELHTRNRSERGGTGRCKGPPLTGIGPGGVPGGLRAGPLPVGSAPLRSWPCL